mmetsp:Transcript_78240/g.209176  ORF Transcript_78240/g.209176 Transcript_78240/m.209176 type:complete len:247 (+) Transcript_78240:29-769(+)
MLAAPGGARAGALARLSHARHFSVIPKHYKFGHGYGNNYKWRAPNLSHEIFRPAVLAPESAAPLKEAVQTKFAKYIPQDYKYQQYIETMRSGDFEGPDYPFKFLDTHYWRRRRYNVTYNELPFDVSMYPDVQYLPSMAAWQVYWLSHGRGRGNHKRGYRNRFLIQGGFLRAKEAAERYRRQLESVGAIGKLRTARQIRQAQIERRQAERFKVTKFTKVWAYGGATKKRMIKAGLIEGRVWKSKARK